MGAAAGAASAPSLCCLERLHTDIWAPPGSWYNSGSDVKWCWEGALEFQRPVSPSLPLWTFTSQVTCPLRERETLAPLKGTGGPSMLQPGGESPECLWELGEGARKSKYRSPEIQIYLRGWCGVSALGRWAPLDRHLGLNQPWCLQEASPAPGHLLGLEGAGRGLTEAMGEGSRREDAGVLARKPALPVWELPRAGADISAPTRLQGFRRGSVRTNCTNPQYLQSIVMWLAPSHMLCIKYLFILVIIL